MPLSAKQAQLLIGLGVTGIVANFSALPAAATVPDELYWVEAAEGTAWLPGSLGGTYYPLGLYYSNGVSWTYQASAYQATQGTVDTGTNNDQFVTALTFTNASKWATKQDVDSDLTAIAGLSPSNDDVIQRKAGAWTNRTMAQLAADLTANLLIGYQGYTLQTDHAPQNPADATTYFSGSAWQKTPVSTGGNRRLYIEKTGTIKAAYVAIINTAAVSTTEQSTVYIRLNNTTDTAISAVVQTDQIFQVFSNTGLSIAVTGGDYIEIKWITPTWVTNPTALEMQVIIYIE